MSEDLVKAAELCSWLRDHSSGAYRPSAEAADLIESLLFRVQPVTAPLPAAPAPTEPPLTWQEKLERGSPETDPAPTEQAGELPPLPPYELVLIKQCMVGNYLSVYRRFQMQDYARAALAARPAPTEAPKEANAWAVMEGGKIIQLSPTKDICDDWLQYSAARTVAPLFFARQAPDSRDARQIADLILGNEGMCITSDLESRTAFGDDIEHRFEIGDGIIRTGVVITLTKLRAPESTAVLAQEKAQ